MRRRKRDAAATSRAVSAAISSRLSLSRSNAFPSSPTLCRCAGVWVTFLIFYARWTLRDETFNALIIKMFGIIRNIFGSLFLVDFIRKNLFDFRWTIIETRAHVSYSFLFTYALIILYVSSLAMDTWHAAPTDADT